MSAPHRRVYHVIARLNIGGPAVHVAELAARLPAPYDPMILTGEVGPTEGDMAYYARERGVEPLVVPGLGRELKPFADLKLVWWLYQVFRRERPAIVHTHTAKAGAVGRLAAWLAGVPVIVHTFHGHVLSGYFGRVKTAVFGAIERGLARVTDAIVTLGERQREEILAFGIGRPEQVLAIPLGLDLDALFRAPRLTGALQRQLGLPADTRLVGIVARLVPIKCHEVFMAAAHHVSLFDRNVHFVIVGDGERRDELGTMAARLGIVGQVHFLGWVKDLAPIYSDLSIAVLSSKNEGLPTTLIEAQAAGVPVVSTDVGAVAEIVQHGTTGWLVQPGDSTGMSSMIGRLLEDGKAADAMGAAGREAMRARFSVDRLIADVERLYASLLRAKNLA